MVDEPSCCAFANNCAPSSVTGRGWVGVGLAQGFAEHDGGGDGDVERAQARAHGHEHAGIGARVDRVGHAGALAAEQQGVARCVVEGGVRDGGAAGQQHDAAAPSTAIGLELLPAGVAGDRDMIEVVEPGPAQGAVGHVESGGRDDVDGHAETGGQTQDRAGVLRDIRLIKCKSQD